MKNIKKILSILLIVSLSFILLSCGKDKPQEKVPYTSLKVLSINDLHGAIESDDDTYGAAGLAWYINQQRSVSGQAVLLLSAGDMFQGSAVSNYSYGRNVIELMNYMKFDCMCIGNHEFDWDLSTTLSYVDGNKDNGEATFPMISCNIIDKTTEKRVEGLQDYQIVDFGEFQVGIIGYMGVGIETDISASKVAQYSFDDPTEYIKKYAKELRQEKGCELVIAMGHDADEVTNVKLAALSGDEAVDMIINGHTHATYTRTIKNGNGVSIPVTQAGTACECVTETTFKFENNVLSNYVSCKNVDLGSYEIYEDETCKAKVNAMVQEIAPIMDEVLCVAGRNVSRSNVAQWIADQIYDVVECDFAAINSGGVRNSAFPIYENSNVTVKKIYEVMPFDNLIKVGKFTGAEVLNIIKINEVFSSNVDVNGKTINGVAIDPEKVYTFACVDYLFDRDEEIYGESEDTTIIQMLVRDIMINALRDLNDSGSKWLA